MNNPSSPGGGILEWVALPALITSSQPLLPVGEREEPPDVGDVETSGAQLTPPALPPPPPPPSAAAFLALLWP